jgi:hypothetical protein
LKESKKEQKDTISDIDKNNTVDTVDLGFIGGELQEKEAN